MENPTFYLEGIVRNRNEMQDFEGPLNLILTLLSKNKIAIHDLRISEILDQYLAQISKMHEMDLDVASEFVQMASYLVYIKTRTLLAGEEEVSELEDLISSLRQLECKDAYTRVKAVTQALAAAAEQGTLLFSKNGEPLQAIGDKSYRYSHEPRELLGALRSVLTRGAPGRGSEKSGLLIPKRIIYGVREKCAQLLSLLACGAVHTLREIYRMSKTRSEIIATFISVLELCSRGSLAITEREGELAIALCGEAPAEIPELISEQERH